MDTTRSPSMSNTSSIARLPTLNGTILDGLGSDGEVKLGTFPEQLVQQRKWYRLGHLGTNGMVVALLATVPGTSLWDKEGGMATETWATLLLVVGLSLVAYLAVQGSDPGYLSEGALDGVALLDASDGDGGLEAGHSNAEHAPISGLSPGTGSDGTQPGLKSLVLPEMIQPVGASPSRKCSAADSAKQLGVLYGVGRHRSHPTISRAATAADSLDDLTPRTYNADVDSRYCAKCAIAVPLRSHHCRQCRRCVATFDHHCNVIGTCIGERNHCRFWWFLFFQTAALLVAAHIAHSGFVRGSGGVTAWASTNSVVLLAACVLWFLLAFVVPLLGMHTWLALSSMTGYECIKGPDGLKYLESTRDFDLPFSQGLAGNIQGFCCLRDGFWSLLGRRWRPVDWKPPGRIDRNSENIWDNCWENKYWSCC